MSEKDFEECEWRISEDANENEIVSNVKEVATNKYDGTNIRVDQFGPYRISFKTNDSKDNRLNYEELSKIAKPLQEYLKLPIYIGGSHSPLSKKMPNSNSDIDIYVITDEYDYSESKELEKRINDFIFDKNIYDKCSIGQVDKNWLKLPYFYESVSINEENWWNLSEKEIDKKLEQRKQNAVEYMKSKSKKDIIKEIESVYGIKVKEEDIVNIVATPRWRSINDSSFRRGSMIQEIEPFNIEEVLKKSNEWLIYDNEETTLYDAIKKSEKELKKDKNEESISVYLNYSQKNGKYWLYNSILNAYAEASAVNSSKINWIFNSIDEDKAEKLKNEIDYISVALNEYSKRNISNNFDNLHEFFERNNYTNRVEEFKKQYRKYRKVCDLDTEIKLYLYSKLNKTNSLFVINPDRKVGKMLKHSGLNVIIPFLNKELNSMNECPNYAKLPPAGYCETGAINLMFGEDTTYNCDCNKEESEILKITKKLWEKFDKSIEFKEKLMEKISKNKQSYSIVDKAENDKKEKTVILFGAPSIDLKNLLLIKTAENLSKEQTEVVVEDIMAPYLYKSGIYNTEEIHRLYKKLENDRTVVNFTSQDENFKTMIEKWMKKLTIKDLKQLSPLVNNSNLYGFHVYDALHLATMGATFEKVKNKTSMVHSYNETALHIFNKILNKKDGYISCHNIPGEVNGRRERLSVDDNEKMDEIEKLAKSVAVEYKDKNYKSLGIYELGKNYIYERIQEEREKEIEKQ